MAFSSKPNPIVVLVLMVGLMAAGCTAPERPEQEHAREAAAYLAARPHTEAATSRAIRVGIVLLGMTPEEAHAAGGAGPYSVQRDPKWPEGTNPLRVIAAQTSAPDNSVIELYFSNTRQFHSLQNVAFTAHVEHGRVIRLEKR